MKKILFLVLSMITTGAMIAQDKAVAEPFMVKKFPASSVKNLESETSGGNITVIGETSDQSRVEVYIRGSNSNNKFSNEEIQKKLDEDFDLNINFDNGTINAKAKRKNSRKNWDNGLSISFTCYVPVNVSTKLTTSGGNISLSGITGTQRFSTSGGNLQLDQLKGKLDGSTSGGNIKVKNAQDDIDLSTSGGNIQAESCSGKISLTTSGGSLTLNDLKGNITATTSGGNVKGMNIQGSLDAGTSGGNVSLSEISGDLDASTSGGNITVQIKEPGKFIRLNNSGGGRTELELPDNKGYNLKLSASKISTSTLHNFNGNTEEDNLKGTLNGGGTEVTVKAGNGRINLILK